MSKPQIQVRINREQMKGKIDDEFSEQNPISEDEIALHTGLHQKLTGTSLKEDGYNPKKRAILRIEVKDSRGDTAIIYRRYRGMSIPEDQAQTGIRTYYSLRAMTGTNEVFATVAWAGGYLGRLLFYWNHIDDAPRVSFKVGVYGMALSIFLWLVEFEDVCRWLIR